MNLGLAKALGSICSMWCARPSSDAATAAYAQVYGAKAVANYFLDKATESNASLTPIKVQKLIYFAHGWNLALFDDPLIQDTVEAYAFGPVISSVFHEFKIERNGTIGRKAAEVDFRSFSVIHPCIAPSDLRSSKLLDKIWEKYGGLCATRLAGMAHCPGTPWAITRASAQGLGHSIPINNELIRRYFKTTMAAPLEHAS